MKIVSRHAWTARPPRRKSDMHSFDEGLFIHYLGQGYPAGMSDEEILRRVQDYHMDTRGWRDIAYSYAIGRSERVFELRGFGVAGGHTKGRDKDSGLFFNFNSMAIVFLIGQGERPTPGMLEAGINLIAMLEAEKGLGELQIRPHRDVRPTACPGNTLAKWARTVKHNSPGAMMNEIQAEALVREWYDRILNRVPDTTGLEHWKVALVNDYPEDDIKWEFLMVRLAADLVARAALAENKSAPVETNKFYNDLADMFEAMTESLKEASNG